MKKNENLKLITYDELQDISDSIGITVGSLMNLEPYVPLLNKVKFYKSYKYLVNLYNKIEEILSNVRDKSDKDK